MSPIATGHYPPAAGGNPAPRFALAPAGNRFTVDLIVYLAALALGGLFVGAFGRLALPGRDPIGLVATILVGVAGSMLAGLTSLLLFDGRAGGGIVVAIAFSTLLVYLIRRARGGTVTRPAGGQPRWRR